MSDLDFTALEQALLDWPTRSLPRASTTTSPIVGRLGQILEAARTKGAFDSLPDLMVLTRQLLLYRSRAGRQERLSVPRDQGWPNSPASWEQFGFEVTTTGTRFLLEPKPWRPNWLGTATDYGGDLFEPEHQALPARRDTRLPMDPFLREVTGFDTYVCPGQREAILSALFMPQGSSLIVNLPTGSGKSLVAQAPALVRGLNAGLTLFVVPTNALALDLERRTREMLQTQDPSREMHDLAWIGGRTDASHEAIKQRIRSGSQGILFASPEAVCGALLHSLYAAARKGLLAYLVVDEAHLIAQWGDAFRPAFQQLSGVRRGLLKACPNLGFRTLLLSATFSRPVIETLETLFGPRERLQMVSAVHLRPEPRYFSYRAHSREEKEARVNELLLCVPRPFILYTTKREDARGWHDQLRRVGFRRIACIHGETPNNDRERVIQDWVADRIDGVVATSAFGVGMDKSDVRTVLHAALPETLDRFYQEVGRGGRDGGACLSICLFDDDDIATARSLTVPTLIGDEKGFERWRTLYREADQDPLDPDVRLVDLRKLPSGLLQQTDYNRDWNMRTLILLARAGLIQLESARPLRLEPSAGEDEGTFEARPQSEHETYFSRIPIRSLDPGLMNPTYFEDRVGVERRRGTETATWAFERMVSALNGEREMARVLVELFASDGVVVSPACRGCPASGGALHEGGSLYQIPPGIGISQVVPHDKETWKRRFGDLDPSMVVVLCPPAEAEEPLLEALRAAVTTFGVLELALHPTLRQRESLFSELHRSMPDRLLVLRDLEDVPAAPDTLPLPRATVLKPWGNQPFPDELLLLDRPLHLVFAPSDLPDARHPLRQYRDTATNCIELQEFLRRARK